MRTFAERTRQQNRARERAKRIRERSGPDSMEWIQSALFLYVAHENGLGKDLQRAVWAYTAAMIDKLEELLTEASHIVGAEDIAETYRWTAMQLRVAIGRHLQLLKMFEGEKDVAVPPVDKAGKAIVRAVHEPTPKDTEDAARYLQKDFKSRHKGYSAVIPDDLDQYY